MPNFRRALPVILIFGLTLLLLGCQENAAHVAQTDPADPAAEQADAVNEEPVLEVTVPAGKTDRLPGSLKWDSVAVYSAGIDFVIDQPAGLRTQVTSTQTATGSTVKQTTETSPASVESEQTVSGTGTTTTTSSYQSSAGGVSTNITVDGSMTVKEQTTIGSGSGSSDNWWNND